MSNLATNMDEVLILDRIADYCDLLGVSCRNNLVEAVDFTKTSHVPQQRSIFGFYAFTFLENADGTMNYGLGVYHLHTGNLLLIGAGQTIGPILSEERPPKGFSIVWTADLMASTPFAGKMKDFRFFSYITHEALPVTDDERGMLWDYFRLIEKHIASTPTDQHTNTIVASLIISLLTLTQRICDRHYMALSNANRDLLSRFEDIVMNYFTSGQSRVHGLPTVQYCADKLCLSPNYFGELIKKGTGRSAKDFIQQVTIARCKILLLGTDKPSMKSLTNWAMPTLNISPAHLRR